MTKRATHIPLRTCVGCRQRDAQTSLLRVVVGEGGDLVQLPGAHRCGRSAYVHDRVSCLSQLAGSRTLGRSLRANVSKKVRAELLTALRGRDVRV